ATSLCLLRPVAYCFAPAATTETHPLSLHDALPIFGETARLVAGDIDCRLLKPMTFMNRSGQGLQAISEYYQISVDEILIVHDERSEEHTSELQSRENLVCRLLLEKKKAQRIATEWA